MEPIEINASDLLADYRWRLQTQSIEALAESEGEDYMRGVSAGMLDALDLLDEIIFSAAIPKED